MPVRVQGPDGNSYSFPDGTDKNAAVAYFKKKGIGPAKTVGDTGNKQNTPGALKRLAQGIGLPSSRAELEAAKPSMTDQVGTAVVGPVYTAGKAIAGYGKNLYEQGKQAFTEAEEAGENIGRGQPIGPNIGKAAAATSDLTLRGVFAPLGGEAYANLGEDVEAGNYRGAIGDVGAAVVNTLLLRTPKENTSPGLLKRTVRTMVNAADQDVVDRATEIAKTSKAKQNVYAKKVGEVNEENANRIRAKEHQAQVEKDFYDKSGEYNRRVDAAEKNAKAENDSNWNIWRKKVAGVKANMQKIVDVIHAQAGLNPDEVREFRSILDETRPDEGDMSDLQLLRHQIATGDSYKLPSYEAASPASKEAIDRAIGSMGMKDVEEAGLKEVPAERLHGWKTQLENGVRKATTGNVKHAVSQVLDAVRDQEVETSKAAGAEDELAKARATHGPYVETFRNSPNKPPTVASKSKAEQIPEFAKREAEEKHLALLNHYDPQIGPTAAHIANLRRQMVALNKAAPETQGLKQLPKVPEKPVVDPRLLREELVKGAAKRWRQTSQYQVRRLAASAITTVLGAVASFTSAGHVAGGISAILGGGYTLAEFTPKLVAPLIDKPAVLKWLAEPSLGDINALKTIPHADAIKIADTITQTAIDEAEAGHYVKVNPDVVHFIGPVRLAAIQMANRPQTPADAKKRIQSVKGENVR